jgi:hypothetical protein
MEVAGGVAVGQGGEQRRGGAQADRASGEVDRIRVFGAAGVGMQAAELAQRAQIAPVEIAEQLRVGVEDRTRMRLDAHAVAGSQPVAEVQRGQDGHDRGAAGLVAADLGVVGIGAHVVGLVDHARGEPQHTLLNALQGGQR